MRDAFLPDENRNLNFDFDLVWNVRSRRFDEGWTVEMAVPFKSIRYPPGREQTWGFNVLRMERRINEASFLSPVPASYGAPGFSKCLPRAHWSACRRRPTVDFSMSNPLR